MAKKSMKEAANQATSVFEQVAQGAQATEGTQDTKDVQDTQDTKDTEDAKATKPVPVRLNLKLPPEIKEYLQMASARESIARKRPVSLTEYLCEIVTADMEKHNGKKED